MAALDPSKDNKKYVYDTVNADIESEKSLRYTEVEHSVTFQKAIKLHYPAVLWALFINTATILKGMDGGIVGSLVGIEPFKGQYGYLYNDTFTIEAS
ncbi:Uu.00g133130.m01.CDS01 [Anthostomella pinea]|uniref:Uu.00g133130.m01.CDS01 n=1 Tax=Anthostomella pinea TaxID=933095 RepID=A0AAI8YMN9_9PEZI|nr:Uu.00g133130.m01.CDS01 [Anthostomella pinea]